jgi:putative Mg2+ transporter-C (MgtC) family protein
LVKELVREFQMELNWSDAASLLIAAVLGGAIGFERELHGKSAGLRTNILICLGACVYTIISTNLVGSDPGRIAAQVVTGIGFIGAGAIIHSGIGIHGLTTAAGIWVVASIGMACGCRKYSLALLAALITIIVLMLLPPLERKIKKDHDNSGESQPGN